MRRISWLAIAGVFAIAGMFLLAGAALAQTLKLEKPRIALSVGGSISQMNKIAYFVALNRKYFQQEGLDVVSQLSVLEPEVRDLIVELVRKDT